MHWNILWLHKEKIRLFFEVFFFFLMRFWLCVCLCAVYHCFLGLSVSAAGILHLFFCATCWVKLSWATKTFSSMLLHFRFLLLHCHRLSAVVFVWFSSSGSDLRREHTVSASDLISSRTELTWGGPCVQTLWWPPVDKLPCCCVGQCCLQPKVIWQLLNGCCWAAALQLLFSCLTLWMSKPPAV